MPLPLQNNARPRSDSRSASHKSVRITRDRSKEIDELVVAASLILSPAWPLHSFIAVSPLQGLESKPFAEAMERAALLFEQERDISGLTELNRQTIKFCQAFFDDGQSTLPMPYRQGGLYHAWRKLAHHDNELMHKQPGLQHWLATLPATPEAAIGACFTKLRVSRTARMALLQQLFATLPGWAGYVKYRTEWCRENESLPNPASLVDYAALRCVLAVINEIDVQALLSSASDKEAVGQRCEQKLRQMSEREALYRQGLLSNLAQQSRLLPWQEPTPRPSAQMVFCIDVRSEPFRRAIEAQGHYETFGFAGFFGVPLRVADTVRGRTTASCPAFVEPQHDALHPHHASHSHQHTLGNRFVAHMRAIYHDMKHQFISPFALAETTGLWSGLWMTLRTFAPQLSDWAVQRFANKEHTECGEHLLHDISPESRLHYAESALRLIGLTSGFAPMVLLCGHGSSTTNNPFASALDCGACGGNHGAENAKALAAILNDDDVRAKLTDRGIEIPQDTKFIAALHDTTTDEITIFHDEKGTVEARLRYGKLCDDLTAAQQANQMDRYRSLEPQEKSLLGARAAILQRKADWAQTRPEWGLAGNASLIIGPRSLTAQLDLDGRTFLHSYDPSTDTHGELLKTILSGPAVVTQWINAHYLFAALNPVAYGSGSKVTHNVIGTIGVMQGNASDLMYGLPIQSLGATDTELRHRIQRLHIVVYATQERVQQALEQLPSVEQLVRNEWVQLTALDPRTHEAFTLKMG